MNLPGVTTEQDSARRARSRRLALLLGLVALGFYAAFVLLGYFKGRH